MTADTRSSLSSSLPLAAVLGLIAGIADWLAWLSWGFSDDHAYSTSQVVACGACAVAAVVLLGVFFRRVPVAVVPLAVAVGLTAAWTIWAAGDDDSGLFMVGAIMMLVGASVSLCVVAGLTRMIVSRR